MPLEGAARRGVAARVKDKVRALSIGGKRGLVKYGTVDLQSRACSDDRSFEGFDRGIAELAAVRLTEADDWVALLLCSRFAGGLSRHRQGSLGSLREQGK